MNKATLKTYMNRKDNRELLKNNCFRYNDKYLVSDSYSIIVLNESYDLNVCDDKFKLHSFVEDMQEKFEISGEFIKIPDKADYYPVTDDYGINMKIYKRILKIINGKETYIFNNKTKNEFLPFIICIYNPKTKEYAYLLPMRCL